MFGLALEVRRLLYTANEIEEITLQTENLDEGDLGTTPSLTTPRDETRTLCSWCLLSRILTAVIYQTPRNGKNCNWRATAAC